MANSAGTTSSYYPAQIPGLTNITAISCGWFHNLALKSDGTVWAWGNNARWRTR
jgi:alpha-tubulin suppressor-like RCC1 family protein